MRTFVFIGLVHPNESNLTLPEFKQVVGEIGQNNNTGEFAIKVTNSAVRAKVVSYKEVENIGTLAFSYESIFQTYINTQTYLTGNEYFLEITELIDIDNSTSVVFKHPAEIIKDTSNKRPFEFMKILNLIQKSSSLHKAFASLNDAISRPRDSAFYCYLAIECVRQHFVLSTDGDDKKKSWVRMNGALNITTSYYNKIQGYAEYLRHGQIKNYLPKDRNDFLESTWYIIDRFLVYLDSGGTDLDLSLYPKLG